MEHSASREVESASEQISRRIEELGNVRRAIDIKEDDTIDEPALQNLIREAVALNGKSKTHST